MQYSSSTNIEAFLWHPSLNTGYDLIDSQHKQIIRLLNNLVNQTNDENYSQLDETFLDIIKYAEVHFNDESKIWSDTLGHDDEWTIKHQISHEAFVIKIHEIRQSSDDIRAENVVLFLIRWLIFHIINDDKLLAFVARGVEQGLSIPQAKEEATIKMMGQSKVLLESVTDIHQSLAMKTFELIRERKIRIETENQLKDANVELSKLALLDPLTGLHNRHHLIATFQSELNRARRNTLVFAYYIIDLDHFKKINDTYGHSCGDDVLKQIGKSIKSSCRRETDFPFRIGGEEFTIISTADNHEKVRLFGEYPREQIENTLINISPSQTISVTASIGCFCRVPTADSTFEEYSAGSDAQLYKAKRAGRNILMVDY